MDWGSTLAPRRARHDTEEAVYLPTQHNAEGALMFLLGNDYDEDASDEFLIGKAAVKTLKYPSASNSVYRAMITIGKDRRSALLRKWVADYSTKPMTKKTAKNLSLFDSPRYNPGKGEKRMQDSACSDVGWGKTRSKEPLSQKTESPYTMRMPTADSRARTVESTPTPQSRRVKSCDSDSFVFLETPLASSIVAEQQVGTGSRYSMGDGWGTPLRHKNDEWESHNGGKLSTPVVKKHTHIKSVPGYASVSTTTPPQFSFNYFGTQQNNDGWGCGNNGKSLASTPDPWGSPPSVSQGRWEPLGASNKSRNAGWGAFDEDIESIKLDGGGDKSIWNDGMSHAANVESSQTPAVVAGQLRNLEYRLADISDTLHQVVHFQEEQKSATADIKPTAIPHACLQQCPGDSIKSLSDLLSLTTKALAAPQVTPQVDTTTRESIHRVEVELAKLSVGFRGQAPPVINNNDGEVALREVKRLDGVLTRAIDTIERQASLIENLEKRQTTFATACNDRAVQCEVRIAECEDQMERYPGDWDTGEMNERINSAVDFDEQLLQKLDFVNDRLDKLENPTALNSYGCARVLCECDDCNTVGQAAEGRKIEDHQNGAGPDWQHNTCSRCPTHTHYTRHCHIPPMELCGWGCGWAEHLGQGCRLGQAPYGVPPSCRCEECVSVPEKDASGSSKTQEDDDGWGPPEPCSACGSTSHNANDCWGDGLCGWCGEEKHQGWKCRERINSGW
ncbi:unnamed protein product [Zymoseptoria tritici ST99CH_1A5]|uniref:Uncharacterized protein n=1 Tax=Zymoseptoria tritici ST99CH_1A5 TaxID=1276529 RepID=A0A1Y6L7R5_ZYMTR|nr:unnamed protein product [Zymoseptoria tritici ST99CH_1A5]